MDSKPVNDASSSAILQPSSQNPAMPASGEFLGLKTTVVDGVEPQLPRSPFDSLDGLFLPVSANFFSMFEPRMFKLPANEMVSSVSAFNHQLLDHMGFPETSQDFFSSWALVDSGLAIPQDEAAQALLTEARELLESAPDDDTVKEKITLYQDGKTVEIIALDEPQTGLFDKLWDFFAKLFNSPFQSLSNKNDQKDFHRTLDILSRRVENSAEQKERKVETTDPNASVRPPDETADFTDESLTPQRKEEVEFLDTAPKGTPVYYQGQLCHVDSSSSAGITLVGLPEGADDVVFSKQLFLPPRFKQATRIINPADVDMAADTVLELQRQEELLYICSELKKGQTIIYKKEDQEGQSYTVAMIVPGEKSPQITLQKPDGSTFDAAIGYLYPPNQEIPPSLRGG